MIGRNLQQQQKKLRTCKIEEITTEKKTLLVDNKM